MYSNGAVSHMEQGKLPMPPALTQRVRPAGGDGSSLPLEPFRFLRGLPANRLAVSSAQSEPEPEPVELMMFSDEPLPLDEPLDLGEPLHLEEPLQLDEPLGLAEPLQLDEPLPLGEPLQLDEPLELAEPFELSEPLQLADAIVAEDAAQAEAVEEPAPVEDILQMTEAPATEAPIESAEQGLEAAQAQEAARELAGRLEQLSRRLRGEQLESLLPSLASGDRFDALVAGFLAGYFSAKDA